MSSCQTTEAALETIIATSKKLTTLTISAFAALAAMVLKQTERAPEYTEDVNCRILAEQEAWRRANYAARKGNAEWTKKGPLPRRGPSMRSMPIRSFSTRFRQRRRWHIRELLERELNDSSFGPCPGGLDAKDLYMNGLRRFEEWDGNPGKIVGWIFGEYCYPGTKEKTSRRDGQNGECGKEVWLHQLW